MTRRESLEPIAYSLEQASQVVPFSREYLAREVRLGRLGAVKFGRRVTIPRENLASWYHDAALRSDREGWLSAIADTGLYREA